MTYSTDWQIIRGPVGAPAITSVSSTQQLPLGTRVTAVDKGSNANGEGEFMYVKGVTNGALGAWAGIDADDYTTTLCTANGVYQLIGIMMSVLDASTKYGWVQIFGKAVGLALAAYADNGDVYLTGTAGSIDDTDVAGDYVLNAVGCSALDTPATGFAEFQLAYPSTDDARDN